VTIVLEVVERRSVVRVQRHRRKRVVETVVLYHTAAHGAATRRGRFTGQLRLPQHMPQQARVNLTATASTKRGIATLATQLLARSRR